LLNVATAHKRVSDWRREVDHGGKGLETQVTTWNLE